MDPLSIPVHNIPPLIFAWLDPSTLAIAACVSRAWRDMAQKVRGEDSFRLVLADLVQTTPLLVWAIENMNERRLPYRMRQRLCDWAAEGGALATLQWARASGYSWGEGTSAAAAGCGHLEVLQWAHANGCPWDEYACVNAAAGGYLEVLQWLRANGCDWDEKTCEAAAAGGNFELLKWAHANGCAWDEMTCTNAAKSGNLEILQWAVANGCPWYRGQCQAVAHKHGHKETAAWIVAQKNGRLRTDELRARNRPE